MCGIAGIIQSSSAFGQEHIRKMTDALTHRGPDGEGFWQNDNGSVLLGHRRLSIIDLSEAAAQPMHYSPPSSQSPNQGSRYTIIHNGEIYNYIELKHELEKRGYHFRSQSDTEVILAAYDCWEEDCVDHFDGMFAFAIWDEQEQELFAARDRFGEKPFFYFFNGQTLAFSSEMKALWAAGIPRINNLKMLFNFITIGYADNPTRPEETFFENISKLPPASRLYYVPSSKELIIEKYWDIDVQNRNKPISDEEAIEEFNALFASSVKRRLRSDVSLGTSLSGGLDSSTIAAQISSSIGSNHHYNCFTAIFPGFEKNERVFSEQVAGQFGMLQHQVALTASDLVKDWDKFTAQQEEPVGSASAFAQYKVFELAQKHNTRVLLDGQGSDEILAGYHKYYKWYWQELFLKRKLIRSGEISQARKLGISETFGFKNVMASLFPDLAAAILEQQYLAHALRMEGLHTDFVKLQSKEAYYTTPPLPTLNGLLHFNTCVHGLEELLRYADRNSMAYGREVRFPFLEHELVEFVFSLPSHFKIRQGWTKWLLRKSMDKKLPDAITWRRDKTGFEPPQKAWMQEKPLQGLIQDARHKLVQEKILSESVLSRPIRASGAYESNNYDWRYLAAASYLK